jgi:hypothetical protein
MVQRCFCFDRRSPKEVLIRWENGIKSFLNGAAYSKSVVCVVCFFAASELLHECQCGAPDLVELSA